MSETVVTQSNTWPFADLHDDIPFGMFADAHVVGAVSCVLTAVTLQAGSLFASLTLTDLSGDLMEVSTGAVTFTPWTKVEFYNAVGKCFGWLLTGPVMPRETVVQDVNYPLAAETCLPVAGYVPANDTGMTGDWIIEGRDGIEVSMEDVDGTTVVSFEPDMDWWTTEDPNAVLRESNDGVWTINGIPGETIGIDCTSGRMYPEIVTEYGEDVFKRVLVVPPLVLFSDAPDGSSKNHYVFEPNKASSWGNRWTGTDGTVSYDPSTGLFTIVMGNVTRTMKINDTVVYKQGSLVRLERLAITWKGLDENDPYRKIIRTSTEDGSTVPYPLDDILTGKINGQTA